MESDFNNEYLGCAGSDSDKWAIVAHDPQSIHVLDNALSQDRIAAFYVLGAGFEIEPSAVTWIS